MRWGNRMNKAVSKGFTIVELLVAIVVIAILAVIVVAGYNAVVANAYDSAVKADLAKLADEIKLKTLDDGVVPDGGATSSNGGNSTVLSGISFSPAKESYDNTVANLYYCSGEINGTKEYAIIAQSASGNAFVYRSNSGLDAYSGYTLTSSNAGVPACAAAGFTAPYTWSYGYTPNTSIAWLPWANESAEIVRNLVLNPRGVGSTAGWFSPLVVNVTATANQTWNGKTDWYRYVWNGTGASTVRLNVNLSDLTNGQRYTSSILVGNPGTASVSWSMDFADVGVTNFTLGPGESTRVYFTTSRATYDSTFRFLDFNLSSTNATGLLVSEAMITAGDAQYLYRDGASVGWTWSGTANASTSSGPGELSN